MAIDDNTTYGLTGAQLKDLPKQTRGKAIKLTTADYDWPTSTPDGIAMWELDEGLYYIDGAQSVSDSVKRYFNDTEYSKDTSAEFFLIVKKSDGTGTTYIYRIVGGYVGTYATDQNGGRVSGQDLVLTEQSVVDNLTSSLDTAPLSAKQGKTLKDTIDGIAIKNAGTPTTSTVGTKGQLLEDTTNGKLYICTDDTNPYVWEEVGAGGGGGTGLVTLSYGNSTWQDFLNAYNAGKIVYCRASSNVDPSSGSQTRMAFMAYVSDATSPTNVEFQYVRSISSHSQSQQGDQVFVYKLTNASGGTWSVTTREMSTEIVAGTNMTSSYSSGTLTLNANANANITMTTTDPGEGSALGANEFIGVYQ